MVRPTSTYRLQLHAGFGFSEALGIVDYLDDLGVGAVYVSPILAAARGSRHGYDLVDPTRIDDALGGQEAFAQWADELGRRGIGRVVDFVPNHVGIGTGENVWWNDVLENGRQSAFAEFFDIEWEPPKRALCGKVLLPILGVQYGEALERGELRVGRDGADFFVAYFDHRLPLCPTTLPGILREAGRAIGDAPARALAEVIDGLEGLPSGEQAPPASRAERARTKERLKRRLGEVLESAPGAAAAVDDAVRRLNGTVGDRPSFDALDALLQAQNYRLSDWRVATDEINYRRFFDHNELAAVRMEDGAVFAVMHDRLAQLVAEGRIDGLRLDHVDGLCDPAAYLRKLRDDLRRAHPRNGELYLVAEKVLQIGERLPRWNADGTTGYDFLGVANGLWVDPAGEATMTHIYRTQTADAGTFDTVASEAKRLIMRTSLSSEIHVLAQALEQLAGGHRRSRDFTLRSLTRALVETLAAFAVYRTYVRGDGSREASDDGHVRAAVTKAKLENPELSPTVFDFVEDMLLLRARDEVGPAAWAAQVRFAMRFQQLSGAVMAKGVEDTAFYRYARLLSLNDVGSQPGTFGVSVASFHATNRDRNERWPGSMIATSTHDTKRAEDARARLAVLSEIPEVWRARVAEWNALALTHQTRLGDDRAPAAHDRYYFYQAMVAALPFEDERKISDEFIRRACDHMAKATKEAKRETRWIHPNEAYDEAVQRFVKGMLCDPLFSGSLRSFVHAIGPAGASNALGQMMLKLTSPGVADVYQGTELWAFDFCDPDNRRPVDYALRRHHLASLTRAPTPWFAAELLRRFEDGRIKMHVCRTLLRLRRAQPELFLGGSYLPLDGGDRVIAFAREGGGHRLVAACARWVTRLTRGAARWAVGDVWGSMRLPAPAGDFVDVLTGRTLRSGGDVALRDLFEVLPLAVLHGRCMPASARSGPG